MKNFIVRDYKGRRHFINGNAVASILLDFELKREDDEPEHAVLISLLSVHGELEYSSQATSIIVTGKQAELVREMVITKESDCDFSSY